MQGNSNGNEMDDLLKTLSKRLSMNPEELKSAAKNGNINDMLKNLNQTDSEKIKKIISNKKATSQILSSTKAQQLLKNLLGEK